MGDFESDLRRFRPVEPPPELRDRIVAASSQTAETAGVRAREWMTPAAVVALTIMFYWLAANERRIAGAAFTPVAPIDEAAEMAVDVQEPQP